MSDELIALQSALAFQEHGLSELNDIIVDQRKQLDLLTQQVKLLQERVGYLEGSLDQRGATTAAADERPPHY